MKVSGISILLAFLFEIFLVYLHEIVKHNKMETKEQLKVMISEKYDEINYLRHKLVTIELETLNNFMGNGYWEFPDEIGLPCGLSNCLIYWYEDAWMDNDEVYVNCLEIASSLTKYRDNTYLEYDMQTQIHFHKQGYIDLIMKYAKRLTKEEFIEKAKKKTF